MGKAKHSRKKGRTPATPKLPQDTSSWLDSLNTPRATAIFAGALLLFIMLFYSPLVFEGKEMGGADIVSMFGMYHQVWEYQKTCDEPVLWNPAMFAGMPYYFQYQPLAYSIDTLINKLKPLINWRILFFWIGGMGMFFLLRYLNLPAIAAMAGALLFILMPHYQALISVGHNTKFRALMWVPTVTLTFLYFINKRTLTATLLFAWAFALLMRTQHYQIIYYAMLFLVFIGLPPYIQLIRQKHWPAFTRLNGLFLISVAIVILSVAQQVLPIREYAHYSTRGGQAVSINTTDVNTKEKKGVGFDYATQWSYSISEFWNFIIPRFHGGTSNERYTGDAVPQLKNKTIPAYWGTMPFTQSYEYLGILAVVLAIMGAIFYWQSTFVRSVVIFIGFALLLSLGKHFAAFYKLFFYYMPYFDKFRVPSMVLTMVMFAVALLAAYGIKGLVEEKWREAPYQKVVWGTLGFFILLTLIPLLFGSTFSLTAPGELERFSRFYGPDNARQFIELLRQARLDILTSSSLRTLGFLIVAGGLLWALSKGWMGKSSTLAILGILAIMDIGWLSHSYLADKYVDIEQLKRQAYKKTALDHYLEKDTSYFRVAPPLQSITNDTRWSYYYHSIGGYSAAKLQVFQDIVDNNLFNPVDTHVPFNLNIISMLNGKYLVARRAWQHPQLKPVAQDNSTQLVLLENQAALPRAFFVDSVKVIADPVQRLTFMNTPDFNPGKLALLEQPLTAPIQAPDSAWARISHYEPNRITVEVYTSAPALLVLSEVYYPRGWTATLDGQTPLEIYKTNHLLRSMRIPAGNHTVELTFHPRTFYTAVTLSRTGFGILYLGLLFQLILYLRSNPQVWQRFRSLKK